MLPHIEQGVISSRIVEQHHLGKICPVAAGFNRAVAINADDIRLDCFIKSEGDLHHGRAFRFFHIQYGGIEFAGRENRVRQLRICHTVDAKRAEFLPQKAIPLQIPAVALVQQPVRLYLAARRTALGVGIIETECPPAGHCRFY